MPVYSWGWMGSPEPQIVWVEQKPSAPAEYTNAEAIYGLTSCVMYGAPVRRLVMFMRSGVAAISA